MKPYPSKRLFESNLWERFTHVHPIMPLLFWGPLSLVFLYRSIEFSVFSFSVAIGGFLSWTLFEYLMHRYLFHWAPRSPFLRRIVYLFHGIHHEQPDDPTRLVMPILPGVILGSVVYSFLYFVVGAGFIDLFFASFLWGYLTYDYTHFAVHHFKPQTPWGVFIKTNHMQHHYKTPALKWGVSSPLWDYIFGTFKEKSNSSQILH